MLNFSSACPAHLANSPSFVPQTMHCPGTMSEFWSRYSPAQSAVAEYVLFGTACQHEIHTHRYAPQISTTGP